MIVVLQLLGVFSLLSICAVGGGTAVLPEMKALTVDHFHWLTEDQFGEIYSLGQLAPGPNMLMVSVIGYRVAGLPGAAAAIVGFFLPAGLLTYAVARVWDRYSDSPLKIACERGLAPITIGLMLAGTLILARTVIHGPEDAAIAAVVTAILLAVKINPVILIVAGGIAGYLIGS
jgi:chromate transporter